MLAKRDKHPVRVVLVSGHQVRWWRICEMEVRCELLALSYIVQALGFRMPRLSSRANYLASRRYLYL